MENNGVLRPNPGLSRFRIEAYLGSNTEVVTDDKLIETSYYDFLLQARPDNSLQIIPLLTGIALKTIYKVSYTLQSNVEAGD